LYCRIPACAGTTEEVSQFMAGSIVRLPVDLDHPTARMAAHLYISAYSHPDDVLLDSPSIKSNPIYLLSCLFLKPNGKQSNGKAHQIYATVAAGICDRNVA
jgi:hypothetical protein